MTVHRRQPRRGRIPTNILVGGDINGNVPTNIRGGNVVENELLIASVKRKHSSEQKLVVFSKQLNNVGSKVVFKVSQKQK